MLSEMSLPPSLPPSLLPSLPPSLPLTLLSSSSDGECCTKASEEALARTEAGSPALSMLYCREGEGGREGGREGGQGETLEGYLMLRGNIIVVPLSVGP